MNTLIFDIETDGLLDELTTVHCIGIVTEGKDDYEVYGPGRSSIAMALKRLALADRLVGHNIQGFDLPAIKKLWPEFRHNAQVIDTLVLSRVMNSNISHEDWERTPEIPPQMCGRHSLESWGYRFGILKGEFGKTTDWKHWTPEMSAYCKRDLEITKILWSRLSAVDPAASSTEHEFAWILENQVKQGFSFDVDKAISLYAELVQSREEIDQRLRTIFPPAKVKMKTPQYWKNPSSGNHYRIKSEAPHSERALLVKGPLKVKEIPFNPGSRTQIANAFIDKYGWEPQSFTPDGRPKVDETVLSSLDYPEAEVLTEYLTIQKRLGQLAEGRGAWLKCEKGGKIHGRINHNGTATHRCTHSAPNLGQVPSVHSPYGEECRSLFKASDGYTLLGIDASQLEIRVLGHYLNDEEYIKEIVDGDIHTKNQQAAGLKTRQQAKVFFYAWLYGSGPAKLGQIAGAGASEGRRLKNRFLNAIPSLKKFVNAVHAKYKSAGVLRGLDGRPIPIRSEHRSVNALIQAGGAVAVKTWTCAMHRAFRRRGWTTDDVRQVAHVHDEIQLEVRPEIAEEVGVAAVYALRAVKDLLNMRCPLDGEYRIGNTWAETH